MAGCRAALSVQWWPVPVGGLLRQLPLRLGLPLPPPGGPQRPRHDGHADQATGGLNIFFSRT